ncbi:MAG TPA: lysophospholipid acyltransferase family protein [bacterium]|nr:lysophospholipid acyltransferase family protein [bacterium]
MLLSAVTAVAKAVPLDTGYRIAELLSEGHRLLSPDRRRAVRSNLQVLLRNGADPDRTTGEVFRNYGRFLFEFLRGPDVDEVPHRFERWDVLEKALARRRGVILAVLHTGNWEITGARLAKAGVPVHAVAGVQLRARWTRELGRRQARAGIRILPPGVASWRDLPRILARNEALALLIDGDVHRRAHALELCGRPVRLPTGPARLAARTGAVLLPMFCRRDPDGGLSARFLDEVTVVDHSPAAIAAATEEMGRRLEKVLHDLASQWLIFRRFFGDPPPQNGSPERAA